MLHRIRCITYLLLLFIIFAPEFSNASGVVKGTVIDYATKYPIFGANIYIPELETGTVSDENGKFEIAVRTPLSARIEISFIGYESKNIFLELDDGDVWEQTIYLDPGALLLDEVRVFGDRVKQTIFKSPNFVSVKAEEEFDKIDKKTTADILKEESGILVQKTTHAHGAPVIRGLIGRYVLLLYNGIRLNNPTYRFGGNQYMNTISAEAINRIEIMRGPTSVLYGSDAIGGTINMITAKYESAGPELRIYPAVQFGYSTADEGKNASFILKGSKNSISFSGSLTYKDIGNLRPGKGFEIQDPTGWTELDGNFNLYYEPSTRNTFELNYLNVNQSDVPRYDKYVTGEYEEWLYEPQKRQLYSLTYTYSPPVSWLHRIKVNMSHQKEHEGRTQRKTGSDTERFDDDKVSTTGAFIQFSSVAGEKHWLNWGAEYYHDVINSTRINTTSGQSSTGRGAFPDNSKYDSFGVYFQETYISGRHFELGLGLRYSYFSYSSPLEEPWGMLKDNFSDFTGSLSASYAINGTVNFVSSLSRGFRAPNFNDSVVLKYSNSGVDAPSPGLTAEKSINYELGLKFDSPSVKGGAFVYYNRMSDMIDRRFGTYQGLSFYDENDNGIFDDGEPAVFQKFNTGEADIYGAELFYRYLFDPFMVSGNLFYSYGESKTGSEPMSRIPPLMGKIGLQWFPSDKFWIEGYTRFAAKQDRLSERDVLDSRIPDGGTAGYITFNLRTILSFGENKIILRAENLFDRLYKEHGSGIYSPGRSFSVTYRFTPDGMKEQQN